MRAANMLRNSRPQTNRVNPLATSQAQPTVINPNQPGRRGAIVNEGATSAPRRGNAPDGFRFLKFGQRESTGDMFRNDPYMMNRINRENLAIRARNQNSPTYLVSEAELSDIRSAGKNPFQNLMGPSLSEQLFASASTGQGAYSQTKPGSVNWVNWVIIAGAGLVAILLGRKLIRG